MQKESKKIEYKESITKTYLKTVSAYANYNDGEIIFGITDDYKVKEISNPVDVCLNIETQINDNIKPHVDYSLRITEENTIILKVKKGPHTPYLYNNKAYKRNDSATIEVDDYEYKRLILEGMNVNFEELKSTNQDLHFTILKEHLVSKLNLNKFDLDTLKTLNLYNNKNEFNNAALLLSDENNFPGLDIVLFGSNYNEIKKRYDLSNQSLIKQFYDSIEIYKNNYIFEEISNGLRQKIEKVPLDAFRETISNALIHRSFDIHAKTKVEMYNDKIVITSPGGMYPGITKEQYLNGSFSNLRNPIIANVFYRLGIVEIFATGIRRIKNSYNNYLVKPNFEISENSIKVTLPIIKEINLTENEKIIFGLMNLNYEYKRQYLEEETGLNKFTLLRILNSLEEKNLIKKSGSGPTIVYKRIK